MSKDALRLTVSETDRWTIEYEGESYRPWGNTCRFNAAEIIIGHRYSEHIDTDTLFKAGARPPSYEDHKFIRAWLKPAYDRRLHTSARYRLFGANTDISEFQVTIEAASSKSPEGIGLQVLTNDISTGAYFVARVKPEILNDYIDVINSPRFDGLFLSVDFVPGFYGPIYQELTEVVMVLTDEIYKDMPRPETFTKIIPLTGWKSVMPDGLPKMSFQLALNQRIAHSVASGIR